MSLPSQSGRSGGFRTARFSVSRPHRRNPLRRLLPLAVLGIGAAAVAFILWPDTTDDAPTTADPDVQADDPTAADPDNATTPIAPITRRDRQPTGTPTLAMGNDTQRSMRPTSGDSTDRRDTDRRHTAAPRGDGQRPDRAAPDRAATPPSDDQRSAPQRTSDALNPDTNANGSATDSAAVAALIAEANGALQDSRIIAAREILNRALHHPGASEAQRVLLRERLTDIAREVTFTPRIVAADPMSREYVVQPGDSLSKIALRENLDTDWRFIARVNNITNPASIRVGQTLKVVQGPFHAEIHKSDYRLDLYADQRDSENNPIFLRSFPVGLGEYDSTPTGNWTVTSRELNPAWVNPRDPKEQYARNDPDNPIGEHWIGLEGTDDHNRTEWGIGIHGTIEPQTIGTQASMGCIRMLQDHIALVFESLAREESTVAILD